jgi:hypothetical protein
MSSADVTVEDTVLVTTVHGKDATRAAAVLALLAVTQLTWFGALAYGAVWLLT